MSALVYYRDDDTSGPLLSATRPPVPSIACRLQYLDEGGANIVYRVHGADNRTGPPPALRGQLLRLRKNLPHAPPTAEQHRAYDELFRPLFAPRHLVAHSPVRLDPSVGPALDVALRGLVRPSHRLHDSLPADEARGTLVTDMTAGDDAVLVQVKPKWLAQSPGAPAGARRCRTCALRASRAARGVRTATDAQGGCPLALLAADPGERERAARRLTHDARIAEFLARGAEAQALLAALRSYQTELDPGGALAARSPDAIYRLCRAMTLRDCTLFIRRSRDGIEARLGDLDLKRPEKLAGWRKVERSLIDEGWYTNDEDAPYLAEERVCLLSRERRS